MCSMHTNADSLDCSHTSVVSSCGEAPANTPQAGTLTNVWRHFDTIEMAEPDVNRKEPFEEVSSMCSEEVSSNMSEMEIRHRTLARTASMPKELLRATHVRVPLGRLGACLRQAHYLQSGASFVSDSIDDFWSHSWSAPVWPKILTLMLEYHWLPGTAVIMIVGCLCPVLAYFDFLPQLLQDIDQMIAYRGMLSMVFGTMASVLTLGCWQSRSKIFLDKICICQHDETKRVAAIYGLNNFLKRSNRMLIIWDASYSTRLWCIFEMAAFVQTKRRDAVNHIRIRPIAAAELFFWCHLFIFFHWSTDNMGGSDVLNFILCTGMLIPATRLLRLIQKDMVTLEQTLSSFSMDDAKCFCCTHGHVHPATQEILKCDRIMIEHCISALFGSKHNFEVFVRSGLAKALQKRMRNAGIPYRWALYASSPTVLAFLDKARVDFPVHGAPKAFSNIVHGVALWIGIFPLFCAVASRLAGFWKIQSDIRCLEAGKTLLAAATIICFYLACISLYWYLPRLVVDGTAATFWGVGLAVLCSIINYHVYQAD